MFLRIGHRGARAYEIENTIESFRKAVELGANAIELDLRQSRDGEIVVCHDDNLKRVFNKDIALHDMTVAQLKEATKSRMPTLREVLDFIKARVEVVLLEIKEPGSEEKILEEVSRVKMDDRVIIVSFHEEALESIRKQDGQIKTGLIYTKHRNPVDAALRLGANYLVPLYRFVHTKDIEKAHNNNLSVIVWTINTREEAIKFIAKGVDGIATDRPDILSD